MKTAKLLDHSNVGELQRELERVQADAMRHARGQKRSQKRCGD